MARPGRIVAPGSGAGRCAQGFGAVAQRSRESAWRSGRGTPTRWGRPSTGPAPTSPSSARSPRRSSCACSTTTARETRITDAGGRRLRLALLPADRAARPALRLPGARSVRPAARRRGATRTSCCSTRTPRRSSGRRRLGSGAVLLPRWATRRGNSTQRRTTRRRTCMQGGGHQPVLRLDRRPRAADPLQRHDHLRGARQGPDQAAPRGPGEPARHLRRPGPPRRDRPPDPARASPRSS